VATGARGRWLGLAALALVIALLPLLPLNRFHYDVLVKSGLNAIVCIGLNLLVGYAGQVSLGHAAFFAIGAYASAILTRPEWGVPGLGAIPLGVAAAAALAFAVARPILRLRGHYLAMATLGIGVIVSIVLNREVGVTGGPDGITVAALFVGPWRLAGVETWYWIVGAVLWLAAFLSLNLIDSPVGRALRALHDSEIAAATAGVDVARLKAGAFVLSAALASLAGSLFAHSERFVTPGEAGFLRSIEFVTMVVLGGMASTFGAVVGASLLTVLPQITAGLADYKHLAFGAILVAVMIFLPRGLVQSLAAFARGLRR
jgi:branched-chain amino acid transport system permease protein